MEVHEYIDTLDREGKLLISAARETEFSTIVPTCPAWTVRDFLAHMGHAFRWSSDYIINAHPDMVPEMDEPEILATAPPADELIAWVEDGHRELVTALRDAPADLDCWMFFPDAPSPLAMWSRRTAHDTTVHRADAELAAGRPLSSIEPAFAEDGINETFFDMGKLRWPPGSQSPKVGKIGLVATDQKKSWTLTVLEKGFAMEPVLSGRDLVVRAPAADILLLLWNRLTLEDCDEVMGRRELMDSWRQQFRPGWQ